MEFLHGKGKTRASHGRGPHTENIGLIFVFVIAALFLGRLFVVDMVIVQGRSMLPSFGPGDIVFIFKAAYGLRNPFGGYLFLWGRPEVRDIVAAIKPDDSKVIIKRLWIDEGGTGAGSVTGGPGRRQGEYFLLGDNKYESVDSREFGPVPMNNILGKVLPFPRL
ncbi:MAG: S26 family signal peptidase [Rectinemataceae bacterium]